MLVQGCQRKVKVRVQYYMLHAIAWYDFTRTLTIYRQFLALWFPKTFLQTLLNDCNAAFSISLNSKSNLSCFINSVIWGRTKIRSVILTSLILENLFLMYVNPVPILSMTEACKYEACRYERGRLTFTASAGDYLPLCFFLKQIRYVLPILSECNSFSCSYSPHTKNNNILCN